MCLWRDFTFRQPGPVPSRHGRGAHTVSVRCLVAEDGSVPDADDAPGNVAVVVRAYRAGLHAAETPLACPRASATPGRAVGLRAGAYAGLRTTLW
ncbi:hypothetical protein C9J60_33725 [Streptomyces sp. A244]|nr:hypothetical protein C9J60_33725 [Streptomyces sp. A244]